jgi:hypothetical protein
MTESREQIAREFWEMEVNALERHVTQRISAETYLKQ